LENKLKSLKKLLKQKKSHSVYAEKLEISVEEVKELLRELREKGVPDEDDEEVVEIEKNKVETVETDHSTGSQRLTIKSDKPLSPREIEQLAGVDSIITFVDRSWLKSSKDGVWTYSILTVTKVKDFYSTLDLNEKLREIFEEVIPYTQTIGEGDKTDQALFVYIADDHAGMQISESLYGNEYSGNIYEQRLMDVAEVISRYDIIFQNIYIIRMGDELDGYNAKTTRYDHDLNSLSNKEQFDIYTKTNKKFYEKVFQSGVAEKYTIINLNNSNHSGNSFSYIANRALEFWIEAAFPFVEIRHQQKFIDVISFGNHLIGLTHGKDEKYMKSPMPLNLDHRTDLWLMEYYKQYNMPEAWVSTIKGDIHKYNINSGKSGRYINVPSICGSSNWIEHNFGDTKPGVLIEIYSKEIEGVASFPIWF